MKRAFSLAFVLFLSLSVFAGTAAAEDGSDPWAAAFNGTAKLMLMPTTVLSIDSQKLFSDRENTDVKFLDLSPDGQTLLCRVRETTEIEPEESGEKENGGNKSTTRTSLPGLKVNASLKTTETVIYLALIRDGELIPVRPNPERGDGDPHEVLNRVLENIGYLPGLEGFSWSADGRYFTFSNVMRTRVEKSFSLNVPVVDTISGEIWLADSYQCKNIFQDDFGQVLLSRMSRDGRYVYYLMLERTEDFWVYRFCRCAPEGGRRETLCDIPWTDDGSPITLLSGSNLLEMPDGSWEMTAADGDRPRFSDSGVLIRFVPSGEAWTVQAHATGISCALEPTCFALSPVSGYGVLVTVDNNSTYDSMNNLSDDSYISLFGLFGRVNLVRILPGDEIQYDTWYLRRRGEEDSAEVEFASGEEYLRWIQARMAGANPEPPADYDPKESIRNHLPFVFNVCLSPDGQYAFLAVNMGSGSWGFYLAQLETMEVRPVETWRPGIASGALSRSAIASRYWPGMVWNPDGTLLIMNESGFLEPFRLEAQ